MADIKRTSQDFIQHFDPITFLKEYRSSVEGDKADGGLTPWTMARLHATFAKGNIKAERMLDIGTGPSIHSVISAAAHCNSVFLSDLTPQCREVLHQWLNNTLPHSFKPFFKFVVDKEGKGELSEERESKLRQKVVGILPIDIQKPQSLEPCWFQRFQLITSSTCFDCAAANIGMYETAARNVDNLLEKGGHVVLVNCLDLAPWKVGDCTFDACRLTPKDTQDIWQRLGYKIVEYKDHQEDIYVDGKILMGGYSLLVARK